ncbi:sialate O-acetylesterase [Belliella marina]|uniref:Sialate O-acetylesterase n=1 Tax=Belliella marina TaxID=1644146 RepID=A0ABW4VKL7_9BACT
MIRQLLVLLLCLCTSVTFSQNLLQNGDFEVWTDPDEFPDGWGTVKSSSSVLWYAQAPEAYSGNHALWLIQPSTNNDHHRRFSSPLIEVEPGEYIIEFYSKGKGKIRWINFTRESEVPGSNNRVLATGSFFGQNLDNDGWVKYTSRLDFPDEYSDWPNVRMHISFNSTAESSDVDNGFFLDMVTVTKVEPPASMTGTFYIDDANGNDAHDGTSPETAWQSLEKVNNTVFGPGANILFKSGGIWFGQLSPQGSGDANSPIVIDQYGVGDKPIIDGDGLDGAGVLSLYNQSYWEINNLEITNEAPEAGDRRGVEVKAGNYGVSTHIHLKNLHIHHITGTVGNDLIAKLSSGIYIATVADDLVDTRFHDVLVEGCHIHDIDNQGIVTNNEVKHSDYPGEADWMRRRFTDVRIRNNTIHHISKNAIIARMMEGGVVEYNLCYETATKITGNTIFSRSSRGTVFQFNEGYLNRSPDYDGSLYDPDLNSPETVWQYSYSHDNAHGLVWFCTSAPDNDVIVRYNISQNDKGSIFCVNFDNHSAYIYNNVVYIPEHLSPTIINERRNADKSYYFYNNIIYNQSTTASYNWFNAKREFSNNIFYGEHPDGEPFDPFKITEDPLFIAPGTGGIGLNTVDGYKLQSNSPAMGKGRHVVDNGGRDYFGNVVSDTLKTDIGFHQLSAIPDDGSYVIHDRIMVMEDAFVRGGDSGDENYGEEEELLVKISPTNDSFSRKSFMKFGLSGFDTTDNIAGVQLVFHARVSDGAPFPIQVYETGNSWNEEDISWNTAPQFGDFVGDVHISGNTFSTYAIDVTSNFMEALAADKILSFGLYDDAQTNYLARIVSKEGGGMQPFLSVTRTENDSTDMDIYILIGQSNMAGRGDMDVLDGEVLENVYLLNGDTWEVASNPLNRYSTVRKSLSMQQLGPGYTFGRKLAEYTGKRIGLVVNARGGSSIQSWQKGYVGAEDYDLYERAVSQALKAMRTGNLKGIIWHQGEANRSMGTAYLDQLGQLVEDLRGDLGADLVLVAGQIGQWRDNSENFNTVIDGIETEITNAFSVKSDGLTPLNGDLSDPHFDGISQRVLGGRYADMILEKVYGKEISPVTVYTECGFGGYSAKLDTGIYTLRKLEQMGILGNSVKGMEVQSNFEVRLHTGDGGEAYLSIMEDTGCLDGSSYDGNLDFVEVLFLEMDTIPPVIGAIHDISVESTIDECGVFLNLEEPEASDNRPGVGISGRRDDGLALDDVFPVGISQVIWTAIDAAGNTTEAIQQIEVLDKQNPLLELKEQISLWPPNGKTYSYTLDDFIASNTDNCGIPDAYIYKITSDEMVSESNFFIHQDCKGMSLIADRDDDGNGRVYQIHIRSEDTSGNVTEREFEVAVPISKNGIVLAEEPVTVVESGCTGGVSTIPVNQTSYSSIIFPNPTQGDATLEIRKNKRAQLMEFKVHDGYHLVWEMSTTVPEGDSFHLLKTSGLKKGAYIVQVLSPEGVVTHKLIVRK